MFLAWVVAAACLLAAPASGQTSGKVGGACAYESYPGFAEIDIRERARRRRSAQAF